MHIKKLVLFEKGHERPIHDALLALGMLWSGPLSAGGAPRAIAEDAQPPLAERRVAQHTPDGHVPRIARSASRACRVFEPVCMLMRCAETVRGLVWYSACSGQLRNWNCVPLWQGLIAVSPDIIFRPPHYGSISNWLGTKMVGRLLESVPKLQQGLQSFRNMRRMEASFKNARALQLRFSQSLARRRQRLSHAIVRSTIQRLGNCTNPFAWSDRLTISVSRRGRNLASALAKIGPWYALSANSFSRNGN